MVFPESPFPKLIMLFWRKFGATSGELGAHIRQNEQSLVETPHFHER